MIPIISHRWQHLYPCVREETISLIFPSRFLPSVAIDHDSIPLLNLHPSSTRGVTWHDWLGPIKIVPGPRVSLVHRSTGPSNPRTQLGFWWQTRRETARKELAGHQPGTPASLWSMFFTGDALQNGIHQRQDVVGAMVMWHDDILGSYSVPCGVLSTL